MFLFIYLFFFFYILAESQPSVKHAFMQIFLWGHFTFMDLYVTVVKTFHELE